MARYYNQEMWDIISSDARYLKTTLQYFQMLRSGGDFAHDTFYERSEYYQIACVLPLKVLHWNGLLEWFERRDCTPWLKMQYLPHYLDLAEHPHIDPSDNDEIEIFLVDFDFGDHSKLQYTDMMRFIEYSNWRYESFNWWSLDLDNPYFYVVLHTYCLSGRVKEYETRDVEDGIRIKCPFRYMSLCRRCHGDFEESLSIDIAITNTVDVHEQYNTLHSIYEIHERTYCFNKLAQRGGYTHFLRILYLEKDLLWCNRCGLACFSISTDDNIVTDNNKYRTMPTNQSCAYIFTKFDMIPGLQIHSDDDGEGWQEAP